MGIRRRRPEGSSVRGATIAVAGVAFAFGRGVASSPPRGRRGAALGGFDGAASGRKTRRLSLEPVRERSRVPRAPREDGSLEGLDSFRESRGVGDEGSLGVP